MSASPTISSAVYHASTGILTLTGSNLTTTASNYNITDFTLTGDANAGYSYTLSSGSVVLGTPTSSSVKIQVSVVDQLSLFYLLDSNGTSAADGTHYNLSATSGWDTTAAAAINTQGVTVSDVLFNSLGNNLSSAWGDALDSQGNIYVADHGIGTLVKIAAGTNTVTTLASGLSAPSGVALDSVGNIYFTDANDNKLYQITANEIAAGTYNKSTLLGTGLLSPSNVVVDSHNNLYVSDSGHNAVKEIDATTHAVTTLATGFFSPEGLAVDSAGNVYVADTYNYAIKKIAPVTHAVTTLATDMNLPGGVAVDSHGNLFVADTGNNALKEIVANTKTEITLFTNLVFSPSDVVVDGTGNLYVADLNNTHILELTDTNYLFNTQPNGNNPVVIDHLIENTGQISLSKAVYTAFAGASSVGAANFSNAASATSATDYLYYNKTNGGVYYDANGSGSGGAVEIAVVGVNSHPASMSAGDFHLVA